MRDAFDLCLYSQPVARALICFTPLSLLLNPERRIMKNLKTLLILAATVSAGASAFAAGHAGAPMAPTEAKKEMPMAAKADMTDGEIRKVDLKAKKVTIKHGVIKNLDMPGMTMVFGVKDAALLSKVKAGDKVKFSAEKSGSSIVVTDIQPSK